MATSSSLTNIYKGDDSAPIVEKIIGFDSASHTTSAGTSSVGLLDRTFEPIFYAGTMQLGVAASISIESSAIVSESALTITDPSDVVENVVFADEVGSYYTFRGVMYDTTINVGTATIEWTWDGVPFTLNVDVS